MITHNHCQPNLQQTLWLTAVMGGGGQTVVLGGDFNLDRRNEGLIDELDDYFCDFAEGVGADIVAGDSECTEGVKFTVKDTILPPEDYRTLWSPGTASHTDRLDYVWFDNMEWQAHTPARFTPEDFFDMPNFFSDHRVYEVFQMANT